MVMRSEEQIRKVIKYLERYIEKDISHPPQIDWHRNLINALEYSLGERDNVGASVSFHNKYDRYINRG